MTDCDFDQDAFADGFACEDAYEAFVDDCRFEWEQAVASEAAAEAVTAAEHAHGVVLTAEERAETVETLMEDFDVTAGEFDDNHERYVTPPAVRFISPAAGVFSVVSEARLRESYRRALARPRCPVRHSSRRPARPRRSRRLVHSRGDPPRDSDPDHDRYLSPCGAVA